MWSFSYTGRGIADASSSHEMAVTDEIEDTAERQLKAMPLRAHPHIRAAADYVKAIARTTNAMTSIVAEGWVEEDGHAACTISVSISASVAPAET